MKTLSPAPDPAPRPRPSVVNVANIVQARTRYSMDVINLPQGQGTGFVWDTQGHIITK